MRILNEKIWNGLSREVRDLLYDIEKHQRNDSNFLAFNDDNWSGVDTCFENVLEEAEVEYAAGASKVCIIDNGSYVVKIPMLFSVTFVEETDDGESTDIRWNGDYIKEDIEVYNTYPVKSLLAKNYPLAVFDTTVYDDWGHENVIVIYAQDKCIPANDDCSESDERINWHSPRSHELVNNYYNATHFSREWMNRYCAYYGEEVAEDFFEMYASDAKYRLNDMCDRNYGYSYDEGIPIIFDYSGYGQI